MSQQFQKLREVIAALRHPVTGCPWDREQTHASLTKYAIEEAYEVVDVIEKDPQVTDPAPLRSELGDLLLQVMLHAQIAEDRGAFSIDDVAETLCKKLIIRHPHVFGETTVSSSAEVAKNWEEIKRKEKGATPQLGGSIPRALPALLRGALLLSRLDKADFPLPSQEARERGQKILSENPPREGHLVDILLALIAVANAGKIDLEGALQKRINSLIERYETVEKVAGSDASREKKEALWHDHR